MRIIPADRALKIDPTMGRRYCHAHGAEVAQAYIGGERYACLHCALAAQAEAREQPAE